METKHRTVDETVIARIFGEERVVLEMLAQRETLSQHQLLEYGFYEPLLSQVVRHLQDKGVVRMECHGIGPENTFLVLTPYGQRAVR